MSYNTSYYPNDIVTEWNRFRCIKILVKYQETLGGAADELKKKVTEMSGDVSKLISDGKTYVTGPSSYERQKEIGNRIKKLHALKTIWGVALPLPNELNDSQTHNWESSKGIIGRKLGGIADETGVNGVLGEVSSLTGFRKPLIDPGYFQDYNGTEPREFTFTWDLIPNNVAEARSIFDIIYNLKKFTLPTSLVEGVGVLSPFMFDIEIGNPAINSLINMNNVVCKSMNVNYAAEGSLQFFSDGTPKYIKLEMSFAEKSVITAEIY